MWQYNHTPEPDELFHHGIKGQKWGKRRFQNKDGSLTPAGKKRYNTEARADLDEKKAAYKDAKKSYNKSFDKAYNKAIAAYSPSKKHRQANDERWNDVADKAEALRKAKSDYKSAKAENTKAAVKKYSKAVDQWSKDQDKSDEKWQEVSAEHKALGKTKLSRIRAVVATEKGKSDVASKYIKMFDDWSTNQDKLDERRREIDALYKETGKTKISRIINVAKYDD